MQTTETRDGQRALVHDMIMREYDGPTRNHALIDALWKVHDALRQEDPDDQPTEILCGDCLYPIDNCYHGTQR